MEYVSHHIEQLGATLSLTHFTAGTVSEIHAMISVEPRSEMFSAQLARIRQAEQQLMQLPEVSGAKPVFKRYFLSDATNQVGALREEDGQCTVSYIQQPPLDGSKLALWIYLQRGTEVANDRQSTIAAHNGYRHIWTMGLYNTTADTSYMQTWETLFTYIDILKQHGATLEANCVRTWFFVRDVDTQYGGLVKSRRECFAEQGLTADTHYIASTGIGGNPSEPKALIQMGCYALSGFKPEQQRYLYAASHLNRTSEYGVTFERGTLLRFGDRNHAIISGTASINNKGEVMHVGDIEKQTYRMWENVEKLLEEAGMTMDDTAQLVVYLRDGSDFEVVSRLFRQKYPHIPTVFTLAPVCRPTWLIEMECLAIKEATNSEFSDF